MLFMQFLGGTNLLTGHTDEHWKAVRKAVAPSFSAGNMKWVSFSPFPSCMPLQADSLF